MSFNNNEPIDRITIDGFDVDIFHNPNANNPSVHKNITATLATVHSKHHFGGVVLSVADTVKRAVNWHLSDKNLTLKNIVYQTVYFNENTLSASPFYHPTDPDCIGIIYNTRNEIKQEFEVNHIFPFIERQVQERQNAELEIINHWFNDEVYYAKVLDRYTDSFYGSDHSKSGLIESVKSIIKQDKWFHIRHNVKRLKHFLHNSIPTSYQTA